MPKVKHHKDQENTTFRVSPWRTRKDKEKQQSSIFSQGSPTGNCVPFHEQEETEESIQMTSLEPDCPEEIPQQERQALLEKYLETLETQPDNQRDVRKAAKVPGVIIMFPDGELRGRTTPDPSGGFQVEVKGTMIRSGRDCLRDNDWQVYSLNLAEAGEKPVRMLASKTGGDAAQISAPLEMHGSEEEDYEQQLRGCTTSTSFKFCCREICDAVNPRELLRLMPENSLDLSEAVVNYGEFIWERMPEGEPGHDIEHQANPQSLFYDSDLDG